MYFVRMPSANAHGCARVFNEGNFVASVFDVFFNNTVPTTQFPQRSSNNAVHSLRSHLRFIELIKSNPNIFFLWALRKKWR